MLFTFTMKASPFFVSLKRRDMGISCHIYAWVMPSVLSYDVNPMGISCHIYVWVMPSIWSCDVNPSASQGKQLSHILMTEVTGTNMQYSNNLSRVHVSVNIWDIYNRHTHTHIYIYGHLLHIMYKIYIYIQQEKFSILMISNFILLLRKWHPVLI